LPRRHSDNAPPATSVSPERVIQFAVGEQSGIRGDPAAMEFQLQAAVEIDPQSAVI
jgi:hypothetical protein